MPDPTLDLSDIPDKVDLSDIPDAPPERTALGKAYDWFNQPVLHPGKWLDKLPNIPITPPELSDTNVQRANDIIPGLGTAVNMPGEFMKGVNQASSDLVDTMFGSPGGLATTLSGVGEEAAAAKGLKGAAEGLNLLTKGLSLPWITHGAHDVINEPTLSGKAKGAVELSGGLLGALHAPETKRAVESEPSITPDDVPPSDVSGQLPPGVKFDAKSGGYILPGKDIELPKPQNKPISFYGTRGKYDITFNNEVDKALWTVANSPPGPKYNSALETVKAASGQTPEQAIQLAKDFKKYVKNYLSNQEPGEHNIPQIYGAEKPQEHAAPVYSTSFGDEGPIDTSGFSPAHKYLLRELLRTHHVKKIEDLPPHIVKSYFDIDMPDNYSPLSDEPFMDFKPGDIMKVTPRYTAPWAEPYNPKLNASYFKWARGGVKFEHLDTSSPIDTPQEMRVPGSSNVAMGGASPKVLKILGSSLYSNDRPTTVVKELLQNSLDEHKIAGSKEPIKIAFGEEDVNPQTQAPSKSVTVKDRGRGLTKDQLYNVFTDLGESGKGNEESAAGGFGFAKAASLLSGDYAHVISVVDTPKGRMKYTFEGNPHDLMNQAKGVPIFEEKTTEPTGLTVKTYFPGDSQLYNARSFVTQLGEQSHGLNSPLETKVYYDKTMGKDFLNNLVPGALTNPRTSEVPQATLDLPGAKINLHFKEDLGERGAYSLNILNKGIYQNTNYGRYGARLPNLPENIAADIIAKVEEGHPDYPFATNREQLNKSVANAIEEWVHDKLVRGALNAENIRIQRSYDEMGILNTDKLGNEIHYYDQGHRFNPEEISYLGQHLKPFTDVLADVNRSILNTADNLKWVMGSGLTKPSERLKKVGLLFAAPNNARTTLGIHIPNPNSLGQDSAILINLFEHLKIAKQLQRQGQDGADHLPTGLLATLTHEQAHIPGGGHDEGFAYRHAQLQEYLGKEKTGKLLANLYGAFTDANGDIKPELSKLLDIYDESRARGARTDDPLLRTGIDQEGPPNKPPRKEGNGGSNGKGPGWKREVYELARGTITSWDLSAPFRQGIGLIGTRQWFKSYIPMFKALGSEEAYKEIMDKVEELPVVRKGIAYNAGLQLTDLSNNLTRREEVLRSTWAEKVPGIRASNRAYTAYLNTLRAYSFQRLYENAPKSVRDNPAYVRQLADYVNDATGRGKYEFGVSNTGVKLNAEKYSHFLNDVFFSGRLMSSRIRMLNPGTYIMLNPYVRQQYLKSLIKMGVAWWGFNQLGKMMGGETTDDPNSADFGKLKFGNTRIDPAGGFQQYVVLASRLASGKFTSSTTGRESTLGTGYKGETRKDVLEQFAAGKLHPTLRFAYDLADASHYKPFNLGDRTLQLYIPMVVGDAKQIIKEDPSLLPWVLPASLGMGAQTYSKNSEKSVFLSPEHDIQFTGGPMASH